MKNQVKINDQFNDWTVIGYSDPKVYDNGRIIHKVLCRCKCGFEYIHPIQQLKKLTRCRQCDFSTRPLKHKDKLVGMKFGKLTVMRLAEQKVFKRPRISWICKCECGKELIVCGENLVSGNSKSCGKCRGKKSKRAPSFTHEDLTNKRYNKILVIDRVYTDKYQNHALWNCICDCGNNVQYTIRQIRKGICGKCYRDNRNKEFLNKIDNIVNTYVGDFFIKQIINYKGSKSLLLLTCSCGKDFECKYCNLKSRKFCKDCDTMKKKSIKSQDLCGQQIGDLTVLEKFHKKGNRTWWDCQCSCGRIVSVPVTRLRTKKAQHCGCKYKRSRGYTYFGQEYEKKPRGRAKSLSLNDRQKYKQWQKEVFKLNGHVCCICKKRGGYLICHHLDGWNWCIAKRYDPQNAAVCCKKCHLRFHKKFGFGNNTKTQFMIFKSQYAVQSATSKYGIRKK